MKQQIINNKKFCTFMILFFTVLLICVLFSGSILCNTNFTGVNQTNYRSNLVINEFMADNSITIASPDGNSPDWIELFNSGNMTIDLSGMYLTDDLTDPMCWQFPEGTTIGPREYLIVWADRNGGEFYASFGLNANGEEIGLFDSDGQTLIDSVIYVKQIQDVSYGRFPDGGSSWNYLLSATPGSSNQNPSIENKSSIWSLFLLIVVFLIAGISIFLFSKFKEGTKK